MVAVVRTLLIITAYLLLPLYGLWYLAGAAADKAEQKRKQR